MNKIKCECGNMATIKLIWSYNDTFVYFCNSCAPRDPYNVAYAVINRDGFNER